MSNKAVIGTASKDAEAKEYGDGKQLVKFSIKHDYDAAKREAKFTDVTCFGTIAPYALGIKKGMPVFAYGKPESREYNGRTYEGLIADCVIFNPYGSTMPPSAPSTSGPAFTELADESELPF
jgi:hypothetical protein